MTIQVKRTKIFMPSLYLASLYEADREAVIGVAIVFGPAEGFWLHFVVMRMKNMFNHTIYIDSMCSVRH